MTGAGFVPDEVFEGRDLLGRRLAEPWQPDTGICGRDPDATVRFGDGQAVSEGFGSIQAAIDHVLSTRSGKAGKRRYVIEIGPGFYEGPVIIPPKAPPISLRGAGAGQTIVAAPIDAMMTGAEYGDNFRAVISKSGPDSRLAFARIAARQRIGTDNSAVLRVCSAEAHLSGLSIMNLYECDRPAAAPVNEEPDARGRYARGQHQAVALMLDQADKAVVEDCAMSGFQDTLYLKCPPEGLARSCFRRCQIEGDVDFIFGGATAFFEACTILSRGVRGAKSWALAPSTSLFLPFGFVFHACQFEHDGAETGRDGSSFLGRQWFEGVRATPYGTPDIKGYTCRLSHTNRLNGASGTISHRTLESVGKIRVSDCSLGPHLDPHRLLDSWAGPDWSPRFRPPQTSLGDLFALLGGWLTANRPRFLGLEDDSSWCDVHEIRPRLRPVGREPT